ncbi:MAG: hypothetical protein A2749_03255 [Parcubacteria group bacterium RIFCSPHIGHO2_01_FULL_45_26]|nr:MAG: hypothetical protein A2749_03255 [Parcubacteria group bacterium RIFCSPHIGHO2_01_FULL_45_26]
MQTKCVLILHNIRSVLNVGAIFRTADAVGVNNIYLTGYTPTPLDRFGRVRSDLHKVALGSEKMVVWEARENIFELIEELKKNSYEIVALEQSPNSVDYKSFKPKKDLTLIVGNEIEGVPKDVLELCDKIIEILMRGKKESLNVSVAAGIALFRILDL